MSYNAIKQIPFNSQLVFVSTVVSTIEWYWIQISWNSLWLRFPLPPLVSIATDSILFKSFKHYQPLLCGTLILDEVKSAARWSVFSQMNLGRTFCQIRERDATETSALAKQRVHPQGELRMCVVCVLARITNCDLWRVVVCWWVE